MNYGGDDQIEAGSTELLRILAAVGYTPLFESANHLSQNMTLFAFVQSSLAKLPKLRRFQPIQHEQSPLNATQLLQGKIKLVLALKGGQPFQHCGRQYGSRLQ
jgi:hypothetical protein